MSAVDRISVTGERSELEHELQRVVARSLSDLIIFDPEDLVSNTVAVTHDVLTFLTTWSESEERREPSAALRDR